MKKEHYKIVGVVVLVLMILFFFTKNVYVFYFASALGVLSYSFESFAKTFAKYWMFFGKTIGNFNAKIILGVFFLLFVMPLGLLKKFFSKKEDKLNSRWIESENSINFKKLW